MLVIFIFSWKFICFDPVDSIYFGQLAGKHLKILVQIFDIVSGCICDVLKY